MNNPSIAITADISSEEQALSLAEKLNIPYVKSDFNAYDFLLRLTSEKLVLESIKEAKSQAIDVDFLEGKMAYRQAKLSSKNESLYKAVGLHKKRPKKVLDLTAGFGKDAFILASFGCEVTMVERSPILWALLADGLKRLKVHQPNILLSLIAGDSVDYLKNNPSLVEVIYLDPMFPEKTKKALPKKEMQFLQHLLGEEMPEDNLLNIALKHAGERVVVKRPVHGPFLGNLAPNHSITTKACRFDVYLL